MTKTEINRARLTRPSGIRMAAMACAAAIILLVAMPTAAIAQAVNYAQKGVPEDPGLGLLQEEAHDLMFFTEKAGGGWVKTLLLDFPGRKPPQKPTGSLKIQIVGIEGKDFAVKWSDIQRIDLWEIRLERETKERIARGDFVGAYPFLSVLIRVCLARTCVGIREPRCCGNDS